MWQSAVQARMESKECSGSWAVIRGSQQGVQGRVDGVGAEHL